MANEIDVTVESVEHVINVSVTGSGPVGEKGEKGDRGERGYDGTAATIRVGNVITNQSEQLARVENVGTPTNAIFDFYLPRGPQGIQGLRGETGRDGIDGHTPVKGEDYWTPADKEEIVTETVGSVQPSVTELANEVDALSQEVSNKMEFYKVVLDGNPLSFKHDGVVVNYAQLADKYRDDKYFLFAEYENVTFIPSLPPDDDPMHDENVLEFTAVWKYSGAMHITTLKINELEQIKVEEFEAVGDVTINGASIVDGGVAAVPTAGEQQRGLLSYYPAYKYGVLDGAIFAKKITASEYPTVSDYAFIGKGSLNNVLATPSIMPTLTDTEKAAARARIGLADKYELIETITISEDGQKLITRTVEPNGTPYNFKCIAFDVIRAVGSSSYGSNVYYGFGTNHFWGNYIAAFNIAGTDAFVRAEIDCSKGIAIPSLSTIAFPFGASVEDKLRIVNTDTISSLCVYFSANIPVGTMLNIYGIRK